MELQRKIRYVIILASLIIFCFQINTALHHLINKNTVDSTEHISISELDSPPVITICPRQKQNTEKLAEYGYSHL